MIRIQEENFSSEAEIARLIKGNPKIGGVVSFLGTVRDFTTKRQDDTTEVTALILEHYPGMTESELEKIETTARARFAVEDILVVHRVGRLLVEENIVLVVAASAHRAEAFDACRFVIDHLKVHATFWKKEITESGEQKWVNSCPGCEAAASQWDDLRNIAHANHPTQEIIPPVPDDSSHSHHNHSHNNHDHAVSWGGLHIGILTLSDSRNRSNDRSGDALEGLVLGFGAHVLAREIIPDEQQSLQDLLVQWSDEKKLDVILTTGGTGPGPRDITPEATRSVCNRELPGFAELIRTEGLKQTRNAVFTRGVAAFRGSTLVINLPGSTRGATHSLSAIADLVPHALRMAQGGGHHHKNDHTHG